MKFTRLLILVLGALVIVTFAIYLRQQRQSSLSVGQFQTGQKLFADIELNNITKVRIEKPAQTITLSKTDSVWRLEEKFYPASFSMIREFLTKIAEAKVIQNVPAMADQWSQLNLVSPIDQGDATKIELFSNTEKPVVLFVGKSPAGASGRYVRLPQHNESIFLINETFPALNYQLNDWLDKQFIRPNKIASVTIKPVIREEWKLFRASETNAFAIEGVKKERLDAIKIDNFVQTLNALRFNDIVATNILTEVFQTPARVEIKTFDDITYDISIGMVTNNHYHVKLHIDDKRQEEKRFENYIYLIPQEQIQPLLDPIAKLLKP